MTAPSIRNHSQQAVRDLVDDRRTPTNVFNPLDAEHRFTLDAASSGLNTKCERYFTRDTDGLLRSWTGERVWCNPPFSRLEPWVAKAWGEMRDGCELVVMLLPANRCEQRFWQEWVEPFRDRAPVDGISLRTRFLTGPHTLCRTGCSEVAEARQPAVRLRTAHLEPRMMAPVSTSAAAAHVIAIAVFWVGVGAFGWAGFLRLAARIAAYREQRRAERAALRRLREDEARFQRIYDRLSLAGEFDRPPGAVPLYARPWASVRIEGAVVYTTLHDLAPRVLREDA